MSFTAPCTLHGEAGLVCRSIFKLCPKITNLLIIADRFLLLNLKQLCEVQLEKSLDLSTVAALFELSDGVNAPRLKRACLELILREWASFVKPEGYLGFRKHAPAKLIQELKYECNRNNVHL